MALCQYCGKVEIAWQQVGPHKQYVAFHAQRDDAGAIVKRDVKNGGAGAGRMVRRPVADVSKPHYPHTHYGPNAAARAASECEVWTPALAQARPRYQKGAKRPWPNFPPTPPMPTPPIELAPGAIVYAPIIPPGGGVAAPEAIDADALRNVARAEIVKVLDEFGIQPPAAEIVIRRADGAAVKIEGAMHRKVPEIIGRLARGKHIYLYGGAGAGKTHAACQALTAVCDDVNVLTMPGLTTGKLFGFTDAAGVYRDTAFVRAYRDGGGIVLDELDRSMSAVAAALNSVLENRRATFDGHEVPMHAKFGLVATGNTDMRGGTRTYTGAQPLDLATAARFAFVYWEVDEGLEDKLVAGAIGKAPAKRLLAWGRALRATLAADRHDTVFAGPREMLRIAEDLAAGVPMGDAVNAWVWRGLDASVVSRVTMRHPVPTIEVKVGA